MSVSSIKRLLVLLAVAWVAFAWPAEAQLARKAAAPSSPPAVVYSTSTGVHFDRDVSIATTIQSSTPWVAAQLGGVTDTTAATVAFWEKGTKSVVGGGSPSTILNGVVFATSGTNTGCEASVNGIGWCIVPSDNSANGTQFSWNDSTGSGAAHGINLASASPQMVNGVWNFFIATYGQGHCAAYHAVQWGTPPTWTTCPGNIGTAITNNLANTSGAFVWNGLKNSASVGDLQDFYASQAYIGCTGAGVPQPDCTGDNTIAPSILNRFIFSGRAVDLGTNCTGPGQGQPAICLTGDATGMQTNKGFATGLSLRASGGAALAADGTIDNAPYSAGVGIVAHAVTLRNLFYNPNAFSTLSTGSATCTGAQTCTFGQTANGLVALPSSGNQPICTGQGTGINGATGCTAADLRVLIVPLAAVATPHDPSAVCPTTDSVPWTLLQSATKFDTLEGMASFACYKFATAGETDTVAGTTWAAPAMFPAWTMLTYANVASVQASGALTSSVGQTSLLTIASGATTLPATASKLVSIWTGYEGSGNARLYTYGGTGFRRMRGSDFAQTPTFVVDEDVPASAVIQRTLTRNVSTHGTSINFYLSLVPNSIPPFFFVGFVGIRRRRPANDNPNAMKDTA